MTDRTSNETAARRWIADRLVWERFLEEATRREGAQDDIAARPAA